MNTLWDRQDLRVQISDRKLTLWKEFSVLCLRNVDYGRSNLFFALTFSPSQSLLRVQHENASHVYFWQSHKLSQKQHV